MSKGLKIMLFWSLIFPIIFTILRFGIDYFLSKDVELLSYTAVFFGVAVAGLILGGPLHYMILKSQEQ